MTNKKKSIVERSYCFATSFPRFIETQRTRASKEQLVLSVRRDARAESSTAAGQGESSTAAGQGESSTAAGQGESSTAAGQGESRARSHRTTTRGSHRATRPCMVHRAMWIEKRIEVALRKNNRDEETIDSRFSKLMSDLSITPTLYYEDRRVSISASVVQGDGPS